MQIKKYYIIRIFKLRKLRYQEAKLNLILMNIIKKILYNIFLKYSNLFKKHQLSPQSLTFKNYKKYHHKHFNATFSLSETKIQNRKKWTIFIDENIDSFFIAYQEEFDQIKNLGWVKNTIDKPVKI